MSQASETMIIGTIGAPYGVKGWVKINSYTDEKAGIFGYVPWIIGTDKTYQVAEWRTHSKTLVAKLTGIDSRDDAESIKNLDISIEAAQLPELSDDEFYWRDLVGMQVVTDKGYSLGKIKEIFATGANDVMLIKANTNDAFGQKERMLPILFDQVIKQIDKTSATITVDWDPAF